MVRNILLVAVSLVPFTAFSQFAAVQNGVWNQGVTWGASGCTTGCVAGIDYPGPNDDAYTEGFKITIGANASVNNLYLFFSTADGLKKTGLGTTTLTVNGELAAYSGSYSSGANYAPPTAAVINSTSALSLVFTNANIDLPDDPYIINPGGWNDSFPLRAVTSNPASGTLAIGDVAILNSLTVSNGTLRLDGSLESSGGSSLITVNSGATLLVNTGNIQGSTTAASSFPTITVNGTLTSANNTTSYVNSGTFNLGVNANLNVGFNGANQTSGWWYQTASAPALTIDPTSTVTYQSNTSQNIYATTYGNLSLSSSSAVTKTLVGSGLTIEENLVVGTNVTFSPSSMVDFTGTIAQTISGTGTLNFNGGININNSASSVSLNISTTISNGVTIAAGTLNLNTATSIGGGITVSSGTLNLGNFTTTLSSGSFSNAATVTSGASGTLSVSGTSSLTGAGSFALNNLSVPASGNATINNNSLSFTGDVSVAGTASISGTNTLTLNNLTVSGSGNATINNSAVTITENITNSNVLTFPTTSTITFSGGIAQTISGSQFGIGNMVVNKTSSTLSNNGNVELFGILTMTTGTFDADGTGSGVFTLNSDANADAAIGTMAGGSITGNVTFERYFNNTNVRWRNIGFPVSSVTYAQLAASIALGTDSLADYTESTLGNVNQGWNYISGGTLPAKLGLTAHIYVSGPTTITVSGPLLQNQPATSGSPYDFGVTYTDDTTQPASQNGWNFLANPFSAPINWNASSGWNKNGSIVTAAAVWDSQNNVYQYSNVGWNGVLAQGQAFWVQTDAANPSLTCTEAVKVVNPKPSFYRIAETEDSQLMVTLQNELSNDVAMIQFNDKASLGFDAAFDSYKLPNRIFNLSSLTNSGESLAGNVLPKSFCSSNIRLNITNINPGTYKISFSGLSSFNDIDSLVLIDKFQNSRKIVSENSLYSFLVTSDDNSYGANRFELDFYFSDITPLTPIISQQNQLLVSNYESGNQWYFDDQPIQNAKGKTLVPTLVGTYKLEVNNGVCNAFSEKILVNDGLSRIYPNPVSDEMSIDVDDILDSNSDVGEILIYSPMGTLVRNETFQKSDTIKNLNMKVYGSGLYVITIKSGDSRILYKAKIIVL